MRKTLLIPLLLLAALAFPAAASAVPAPPDDDLAPETLPTLPGSVEDDIDAERLSRIIVARRVRQIVGSANARALRVEALGCVRTSPGVIPPRWACAVRLLALLRSGGGYVAPYRSFDPEDDLGPEQLPTRPGLRRSLLARCLVAVRITGGDSPTASIGFRQCFRANRGGVVR